MQNGLYTRGFLLYLKGCFDIFYIYVRLFVKPHFSIRSLVTFQLKSKATKLFRWEFWFFSHDHKAFSMRKQNYWKICLLYIFVRSLTWILRFRDTNVSIFGSQHMRSYIRPGIYSKPFFWTFLTVSRILI